MLTGTALKITATNTKEEEWSQDEMHAASVLFNMLKTPTSVIQTNISDEQLQVSGCLFVSTLNILYVLMSTSCFDIYQDGV